jgi:predicted ATP-grasp superfamily ATP-dependent carboligase
VIILGGTANALSVARSLGRRGVSVYALNDSDAHVRYSRWCRWLPVHWRGCDEASWAGYLLGPESEPLRGAVVLAACDAGIQTIAHNRAALAGRYLLDESDPVAQLAMLDKLRTYQIAREAGVPTPQWWVLEANTRLDDLAGELVYPLLVKPLLSHVFAAKFGKKFFTAGNLDEVRQAHAMAREAGVDVMLLEMVPGPDDRLCSYYTYLDAHGRPQFHFTKRVLRRFPVNMGEACYHVTDHNPEVAELSLRLFRHAGLRGLANAEFKRDLRDGRLKLIECNARFTAANGLVAASGLDLAAFVYNRLTGRPLPPLDHYRAGLRLWYPTRDWQAFLQLRRRGELTLWGWLRSVTHRQTFPYFRWDDPLPTLLSGLRAVKADVLYCRTRDLLRSGAARCRGWLRAPASQPS